MALYDISIQIASLSILIGSAYLFGKIADRLKLGEVVGQIFGGIVAGPHLFIVLAKIFPSVKPLVGSRFFHVYNDAFEHQHFFVFMFLGLIAFSIGEELHFDRLKSLGLSTLFISIIQTVLTFGAVTAGFYLATDVSLPLAAVMGSIGVATAPAVTFILMAKFEIQGKLKNIMANVLVIQDIFGLVLFSILVEVARGSIKGSTLSGFSMAKGILMQFAASVVIGFILFIVLKFAIKHVNHEDHDDKDYEVKSLLSTILSEHPTPSVEIFIIMISTVSLSIAISMYFHFPFMVTAIFAGMLISNFHSHAIFDSLRIGNLMPIFNLLFFALIGANVKLETFSSSVLSLIILYVVLRSFGKVAGGWIGCKFSGMDPKITAVLPRLMLPQAGLAAVETIFAASILKGYGGELIRNIVIPGIVVFEVTGAWLSERTLMKWKSWIVGEDEALHSRLKNEKVSATFSSLVGNRVMELMSRTKEEAISEMSQLLHRSGRVKDVNYLQQQILEREKLESTSIGFGVAVPHCRSLEVKETIIVTGVVRHGFKWHKRDKEPIEIIFLIVTPSDDPEKHLEALKIVAQTVGCPNFRKEIGNILASSNIQLELKNRFDS